VKGKVKSWDGFALQAREEDGLLRDGLVIFLGTYFGTHFRGQQIIVGFTVDFYCHKAALVIGLDGNVLKGVEQKEGDSKCDKALNELRLKIVRFKNDEVLKNLSQVVGEIKESVWTRQA
jgi:very-short-patch-repair endonuclease